MTDPRKKPVVDEEMVRALAELLQETGLTEIEYGDGDLRIRVAKNAVAGFAPAVPSVPAIEHGAPTGPAPDSIADHPGLVKSPMVGVVYTSPEPGAPEYTRVGDTVAVGDTLLLIEAMKVFNPIDAPHAGRVTQVFVSSGMPVEYGEPLMIIE